MENVNLVRGAFIGISLLFVAPSSIGESSVTNLAMKNETSVHRHVKQFVSRYIKANSEDLQLIAKRSKKPFAITDEVFRSYKLPIQLKYLAVIESELKTTALSKVGARGPWQLMPETARVLGLKVTSDEDERTEYYKSTKAAAKYLKDLYGEFGDWLLVLAAYNGGPGPVYHAMQVSGSRNFWTLQAYLPAESRMHVKRYIATCYYFERDEAFIASL